MATHSSDSATQWECGEGNVKGCRLNNLAPIRDEYRQQLGYCQPILGSALTAKVGMASKRERTRIGEPRRRAGSGPSALDTKGRALDPPTTRKRQSCHD